MLYASNIEHYDDFDDCIIAWVEIAPAGIPDIIVEHAKEIDNDEYMDSCFGCCVGYDKDRKELYMIQDSGDEKELYYIDNNGDKHWFDYKFVGLEKLMIFQKVAEII